MGQYRIVGRIAGGGVADVFLARLLGAGGFEKPVVIKRISAAAVEAPGALEAFLREARRCLQLGHPGVVQLLDVGVGAGGPYLVSELVDGEGLHEVLGSAARARAPILGAEGLHVAACVADALAHAHDAPGPGGAPRRIVHGGVRPANVLISIHGQVKLAAFGVARAATLRQPTLGDLASGKLGYLAPELLGCGEVLPASDVFLTGLLLFELLAGRPFFPPAATPKDALALVASHDESKVFLPAGAPPELLPVLRLALARDPGARYGSARELSQALRRIAGERRLHVGPAELSARMAALFPARESIGASLGGGLPVRPDARPLAPRSRAQPRAAEPTRRLPAPAPSLPQPRKKRLGELLVEAGLLTPPQLQTLLARQRHQGGKLGDWAMAMDFVDSTRLLGTLARQLGMLFVDDDELLGLEPPPAVLARFPEAAALLHLALPLAERDGWLMVAMVDPGDLANLDLVRFRLGVRMKPVICSEAGLRRAIARVYRPRAEALKWQQADLLGPCSPYAARTLDLEPSSHAAP